MRIQPAKTKSTQGNVILICVIFSFVLGITIASYLQLVESQYTITLRSHDWNGAMVLAEAGVEEGMAFINKYSGNYTGSQNWADTAAADGWDINGNVYHVQRTVDPTLGCYDVWVTNWNSTISVCAVGSAFWNQQPVVGPQAPSAGPETATSGTDTSAIVRQVLVQTTNDPLFSVAMASTGPINLNGFGISADSFDSGDPSHSVWNSSVQYYVYSPAVRKSDGFLATDSSVANMAAPGNTLIYGNVSTGPGGETNLMQNGSVGNAGWVPAMGIQPGHGEDDMNVVFQNVSLPSAIPTQIGPILPPLSIPGYYEDSDNLGLIHPLVVETNNVIVYLPSGVNYGGFGGYGFGEGEGEGQGQGQGQTHAITVASGSATLYIGQNFNLGLTGNITNETGNAADLCIYGLNSLTNINLGSVSSFTGTIYAPQANLVLGNPGFTTVFTGSIIAQSITLNGNVQFHYDENLRRVGPTRAYVPISWTEF